MENNDQIHVPELALPKGGGAIHGLNETVQSVGMTGMASLSIPLPVSAGRGFAPSLALSYSSGSGNGPFGMGWSVGLPAIARRLADGVPAYTPEDAFVGPNGEELVPELDAQQKIVVTEVQQYDGRPLEGMYWVVRFFPRIEGSFDRIERWTPTKTEQPCFWLIHGADGSVHLYGKTAAGRIADPASPNTRIARWLLEESLSPTGEHIYYAYRSENADGLTEADKLRDHTANRYLVRVCYGNKKWCPFLYLWDADSVPDKSWHFEVHFDYAVPTKQGVEQPTFGTARLWERRKDTFSDYATGFEVRTHRLCQQISLFHAFDELGEAPVPVKRMLLDYEKTPFLSTLQVVENYGVGQDVKNDKLLPGTYFGYEHFQLDRAHFRLLSPLVGLDDAKRYQLVDLYGEGIPGILYRDESGWRYRAPQRDMTGTVAEKHDAVTYGPWHPLPSAPLGHSRANTLHTLTDLTGNGQLDWVSTRPGQAGFFTQRPDKTWSDFTPFAAFPSEFLHPHAQLANLMGAGLSDLVLIGPKSVRFYANQREQGFAPSLEIPHTGDALPLAGTSHQEVVAFSDVLGSGQQHLVRVRHDMVTCWPNLGRGRFGNPINWTIKLPVKEALFNPACVFLADLDGSGAADLIYVQSDGLCIFRNQSGNGFDEPRVLHFPEGLRYDALCHLNFADIDGLGCASLILTVPHPQPQHWRYDFSQGRKPYLLTSIDNKMGLEVYFTYRSSAQEWLDEKNHLSKTGQIAISHLPFPVHVVQKITHLDEITDNTLTQQFAYRHGYYDGQAREFRGFGLVIHTDTEHFPALSTQDKKDTYTAPVMTKTWYHTGVDQDTQSRAGYSTHDREAMSLKPTLFTRFDPKTKKEKLLTTAALDTPRRNEMARALKGSVLREEVFGLDRPDAGPYTTSESRYLVRCVQGGGADRRMVVLPLPLETLSYHYERTLTDPVCTQQINLAWDQYGSLMRSATIHHPRRDGASPFTDAFQTKWWQASQDAAQKVMWLTETHHAWHHLDTSQAWRLALLYQTRTEAREILQDEIPASIDYESLCDPRTVLDGTSTLLSHQIYRYETDNTIQNPPVTREGLLQHIESAEFNDQTLQAYKDLPELSGAALKPALEKAGYIALSGALWSTERETLWAIKQSICTYDTPNHFRRLIGYQPAAGVGGTTITYDPYACLVTCVTDAMGHQTKAQYDYRYLLPFRLIDPNENVQEAHYDALGRLSVSSFYGKEAGQRVGFAPLYEGAHLTKQAMARLTISIEQVLQKPERALGPYATAYFYDALNWITDRKPVHSAALVSDNYANDPNAQVRITLVHSDGFGRVLQTRQKVEPGLAYKIDRRHEFTIKNGKPVEIETDTRWVVSGRVEYNNKGLPVRSYQPYFINSSRYIDDAAFRDFGYYDTHYYDPLGREVRVVTAQGYLRRQTYHAWYGIKEDENDTLAEVLVQQSAQAQPALEVEVKHGT